MVSPPALALAPGDIIQDTTPLFDDGSAAFAPNGFGSGVVSWDDQRSRWVIEMEYMSGNTAPECPHGIWGVGIATSIDPEGDGGWNTPIQLYEPTAADRAAGRPYGCVVAHPEALWGGPNRRIQILLFKAESGNNTAACTAVGADPLTCMYTGIGSMTVRFRPNGSLLGLPVPNPTLRVNIPGEIFGFQSPILLNGTTYYMLIQKEIPLVNPSDPTTFGLYSTSTSTPGGAWSALTLVQSPGAFSWDINELFGQELICADNGDLVSFQGGRSWLPGGTLIDEAGLGLMTSTDGGASFTLDPMPLATWNNDLDFRHWSVIRVGPDDYRMWIVNKDASGHLAIYYAEAFATNLPGTPIDRVCP